MMAAWAATRTRVAGAASLSLIFSSIPSAGRGQNGDPRYIINSGIDTSFVIPRKHASPYSSFMPSNTLRKAMR